MEHQQSVIRMILLTVSLIPILPVLKNAWHWESEVSSAKFDRVMVSTTLHCHQVSTTLHISSDSWSHSSPCLQCFVTKRSIVDMGGVDKWADGVSIILVAIIMCVYPSISVYYAHKLIAPPYFHGWLNFPKKLIFFAEKKSNAKIRPRKSPHILGLLYMKFNIVLNPSKGILKNIAACWHENGDSAQLSNFGSLHKEVCLRQCCLRLPSERINDCLNVRQTW